MVSYLRAATALSVALLASSALAQPLEFTVYPEKSNATVGSSLLYGLENAGHGSATGISVQEAMKEFSQKPAAIELVPAEAFKKSYAMNLADMLKTTPGVVAEKRWGEEVRLSIRGSGIGRGFHLRGIQLYQDGIPFNTADGAGDFQEIDPLFARYLEVYKGASALQFGATTLGGAINMVSPTGHTAPADNELRVESGSFGTLRTHANVARRMGNVDMFSAFTGVRSSGWREQSQQLTGRLNSNVGVKVNDATETRFYLSYNNINQEVPGTISRSDAIENPKIAPLANRRNDYQRDIRSLRVANKTTHKLSDSETIEISPYVAWKDLDHPIAIFVDQRSMNYGLTGKYKGEGKLSGKRNTLTLGSNLRFGDTHAKVFQNILGSRGNRTGNANQLSQNYELFAENQWYATPEISLVLGGQGVLARRELENHITQTLSDTQDYAAFSPKIGVLWDVAKGQQLFANVSKSVEPPTFSELTQGGIATDFSQLSAQKAWTGEVGSRASLKHWAWDVTAFHSRIKNELLNFDVGAGIPASAFNAGDTVHQGLELGLDMDVGYAFLQPEKDGKLVLGQTYTYSDFTFDDDRIYGDNDIAGVAKHAYRTELQYTAPQGWKIAPNLNWVPDAAFVDHANTLKSTGYAIYGVSASVPITAGVEWYVEGRNLGDKRYISNFSTVADARTAANLNVYYPGEGRAFYTGVSYRF